MVFNLTTQSIAVSLKYSDVKKFFFISSTVTFPNPFSRLLDVHVIIGDDQKLYHLMNGLEEEINTSSDDRQESWDKLDWLMNE